MQCYELSELQHVITFVQMLHYLPNESSIHAHVNTVFVNIMKDIFLCINY